MNKIWSYGLILSVFFCATNASATHREILDASNLITGTIPNARQDSSSVTLQGNLFNGTSQLIQANADGFVNNADIDPSSVTKLGNTFNGASQIIVADSDGFVPNADINPSSVTKRGNNFNGASQLLLLDSNGLVDGADLDNSSVTKRGQLTDGLQMLEVSSLTSRGSITTTDTVKAGTFQGSGNFLTNAIAVMDEDSFSGRVSTINFKGAGVSMTVSGSTAVVTISGGGSGGGAGFSTTTPRSYSIIVATGYGLGADIVGTTDQAWRAAITSANMMGVSSIFIRSGTYNFSEGVTTYMHLNSELYITCEASTTVTTTGMNQALIIGSFTVVDGGFFRTPALYTGVGFVEMKSTSTLKNATFDANLNDDGSAYGNPALLVQGVNVHVDNVSCSKLITNTASTKFANIFNSSNVYVRNFKGYAHTMDVNGNSSWFNIQNSADVEFLDNEHITTNGYDFLIRGGGSTSGRIKISRGKYKHTGTTNETSIYIFPSAGDVSSGTIISGNDFIWNGAGTVIDFDSTGGNEIYGASIENNSYFGSAYSGTFVDVEANCINIRFSDNKTYNAGAFISDAGTGTILNDNFLNGNPVADN